MFSLPSGNTQEMFSLSFSLFPASKVKKLWKSFYLSNMKILLSTREAESTK